MSAKPVEKLIENLGILVVDESQYMRKLTRMMLMNIGAKTIYEASDGVAALDIIRTANPDVAIIDWDLPVLSGAQVIKIVRSPRGFPEAASADHHADRLRATLAGGGGDAARRARIPAQADLAAGVAGSSALDRRQAAPDGADRQVLRSGAAAPGRFGRGPLRGLTFTFVITGPVRSAEARCERAPDRQLRLSCWSQYSRSQGFLVAISPKADSLRSA